MIPLQLVRSAREHHPICRMSRSRNEFDGTRIHLNMRPLPLPLQRVVLYHTRIPPHWQVHCPRHQRRRSNRSVSSRRVTDAGTTGAGSGIRTLRLLAAIGGHIWTVIPVQTPIARSSQPPTGHCNGTGQTPEGGVRHTSGGGRSVW